MVGWKFVGIRKGRLYLLDSLCRESVYFFLEGRRGGVGKLSAH